MRAALVCAVIGLSCGLLVPRRVDAARFEAPLHRGRAVARRDCRAITRRRDALAARRRRGRGGRALRGQGGAADRRDDGAGRLRCQGMACCRATRPRRCSRDSRGASSPSSAEGSRAPEIARIHARRVLEDDVRGTIKRVATKLYLLADSDEDGQVSLPELAGLFGVVRSAPDAETFPQPLRALAGSLQLLPPSESAAATSAADRSTAWHIGVQGDDVRCGPSSDGFSDVGIGRSADAVGVLRARARRLLRRWIIRGVARAAVRFPDAWP